MTAPAMSISTANGRFYVRPGRNDQKPSVTNIIGMMDKPALKYWAAKECATYASVNRAKLATLNESEAFQLVRGAPFQRTDDSAAAIGDIVHGWVEYFVKTGLRSLDIDGAHQTARHMWQSFEAFHKHYKPQYTGSEFTVWSDKYGYAGTADLSFTVGNVHVLCDAKTGKGVYPETAMQLAALAKADVILAEDGTEKPVPAYDRFAILHLRPRSASLVPVENIDAAFECFLALKTAFDWKIEHADKSLGFAPKIGAFNSTSNQGE